MCVCVYIYTCIYTIYGYLYAHYIFFFFFFFTLVNSFLPTEYYVSIVDGRAPAVGDRKVEKKYDIKNKTSKNNCRRDIILFSCLPGVHLSNAINFIPSRIIGPQHLTTYVHIMAYMATNRNRARHYYIYYNDCIYIYIMYYYYYTSIYWHWLRQHWIFL